MTPEIIEHMQLRITAHEWLLEVIFANWLANLREDNSEELKQGLVSKPAHLPPNSGPVDVAALMSFQNALTPHIEDILRKVSAREAEIRAKLAAL